MMVNVADCWSFLHWEAKKMMATCKEDRQWNGFGCLQWKENGSWEGFENFGLLKGKIACRKTSFKISQRRGTAYGGKGNVLHHCSHSAFLFPMCDFHEVFSGVLKLIELENQIRRETELRNKAEKRLKLLIKKLESLNIASSTSLVASEISTLSDSSTNSSALKETENQESRSENVDSTISENQCEKVPEIATSKQRDEKKPNQNTPDRANSSPNSESRNNSCTDPHRSSQIPQRKDQRY